MALNDKIQHNGGFYIIKVLLSNQRDCNSVTNNKKITVSFFLIMEKKSQFYSVYYYKAFSISNIINNAIVTAMEYFR